MKHFTKAALVAALGLSLAFSSASFADNNTSDKAKNKPTAIKPAAKPAALKLASNDASNKKTAKTPMSAAVNPAERTKIEGIVHDYLIQNPEIIVEALQIMQRKQYEQAEQTIKKTQKTASKFANALFMQTSDPVAGDPKGTISVVEFFDYQCPHCVDMAPTMEAIMKTNPSIRVIYKEFPIRGPISNLAARAALAANKQGKYYELHHAMLTTKQPLTEEAIYEFAAKAGINVDQLKKDMKSKEIEDQLKENMKLAQDLKLFGTPAFFIGKSDGKGHIEYVPGQMNQEQLQNAINQAKA